MDPANLGAGAGAGAGATPGTESERRRSRLCLVCGGDAESFHLNYGASACLSCRAFFRR